MGYTSKKKNIRGLRQVAWAHFFSY